MNRRNWGSGTLVGAGRKGFTLVELLIVIGIIGVLISILLPALAKARASAQEAACMSNLRQWGMAWYMYCDANRGIMPFDGPDGSGKSAQGKQIGTASYNIPGGPNTLVGINDSCLWYNAIPIYINNKAYYDMIQDNNNNVNALPKDGSNSVFVCPSAEPAGSYDAGTYGGADNETVTNGYFMNNCTDPAATTNPTKDSMYLSYVMNSALYGTAANKIQYKAWKLSQLQPGPDCVLMSECICNSGEYLDPTVINLCTQALAAGGNAVALAKNHSNTYGYLAWVDQPKSDWKRFSTRHNHGGNVLYADGHVDWHAWSDLQIQPSDPSWTVINTDGSYGNGNKPGVAVWNPLAPVN